MPKKTVDLVGQKFGRLTVIEIAEKGKKGRTKWKCRCDCEKEVNKRMDTLLSGLSTSCGCLTRELASKRAIKHGMYGTSTYNAWNTMIDRCTNPKNKHYELYGGRGITVDPNWIESFQNFLNDVGEKPGSEYSLDRIDVNGSYTKNNVRWATSKQQAQNRRDNRILEWRGESKCLQEWADILGISASTIYSRLDQLGWSIEQTLATPPEEQAKLIEWNHKKQSISAWEKELGFPRETIRQRLNILGWSIEKALTKPVAKKNKK